MSRETEAGLLAVENEALRAEIERLRLDLANEKAAIDSACSTVAAMHAAAMGRVCGPRLGVVEDVAALRAALVSWVGQHGCVCGHPACKRCRETREARLVLGDET
jgi:hypothetical protein